MPGWLEPLATPEILFPTALILLLLYLMARTVWKSFPVVSSFVALIHMLVGDKEKGIPSLAERMDAQARKLDTNAEAQEKNTEAQEALRDALQNQAKVLERVRAQVENSHDTNFRDDVDKITANVRSLTEEFKDHVAISKAKDKDGDEYAYRVAVLTDKMNKIQPIVEELGKTWGAKSRNN